MDRFQEMQVFMAVADEEGFAAAARRLNLSPPSVTRAIAALEERIGTQLLARTTRSLHLSEAGQLYLEDCRRILAELEEAEESASGSYTTPRGQLTVTASVIFGELFMTPILAGYLDLFPSVNINALFVDRLVNLVDEGVDVAIRIGNLPESSQQTIKVGEVSQVICGTPAYFSEHGRPQHPDDLRQARVVMSSASHLLSDWQFVDNGKVLELRPEPRLVVSANQAAINAASLGWGLTRVLSYQVASKVAAGELEIVLQDFAPPSLPIHIVYQGGSRVPAKIRTFVDFCAERMGQDRALNPSAKSAN
ncbi:LysR family transcriptional regulator [Pseudomonas sp. NA-150]|uniref:LysR family transcriptional regulator n=1 Tax=Pseudomonas sp. NA-150 TaxID=3367525 RepID=UPI0037CC0B52